MPINNGSDGVPTRAFGASGSGRPTAHDVATRMLAFGRARAAAFAEYDMPINDIAWELLLGLFVAQERGRRLTLQRLCDDTRLPTVVTLRWMRALRASGLVQYDDERDDQMAQARLTSAGEDTLRGLIGD